MDKWHSLIKSLSDSGDFEGAFARPRPRERLAFSLFPEGIPLGALTQVQGPGATEALLRLLAEHPQHKAAWVEQRLSAYPPGFVQRGANLNCLLFVEGGEHFSWALAQLLRSQVFKVVIAASPLRGEGMELGLRRLQLAAEQSGTALLIAAECEGPRWALRLRLEAGMKDGMVFLRQSSDDEAIREAAS